MPDEEGYPTEEELTRVREWSWKDCAGLLAYVHELWNLADWGWYEEDGAGMWHHHPETRAQVYPKVRVFYISTVGWSGNERLIEAMQANDMFWSLCWQSRRRGGHYRFHVGNYYEDVAAAGTPPTDIERVIAEVGEAAPVKLAPAMMLMWGLVTPENKKRFMELWHQGVTDA